MPRWLRRVLTDVLPASELQQISGGIDLIGDIAILRIPSNLQHRSKLIGETILANLANVKAVYEQVSPVSGEYRTRSLALIAGERRKTVTYREHGAEFLVEPQSVYFTPRLSTERMRIAELVAEDEFVVNLFGGVGTYSIIIARHQPASRNYTIDSNPIAHQLALKNIEVNKLSGRVVAVEGDCREVVQDQFRGKASRILMPLPERAAEYLDTADSAVRPEGGWVHYYAHVHYDTDEQPEKKVQSLLREMIPDEWRVAYARKVRDVGPRWSEVVLDFKVR
jgi:tRNA (guanine37-N1)-methyltransferase